MADTDPTYAQTHDATDSDADDGSSVTDVLTCVTDDDTGVNCVKQGKSPDDILRLQYPGLVNAQVGDTVSVYWQSAHNYVNMELKPYDGAISVDATVGIVYDTSGGSPSVFTLTSNFLSALHDLGSGLGACRVSEEGATIDGDVQITECRSDLTSAGGDNRRRQVLHRRRR